MPPPPTRSSPKPTSPTLPRIVPRGPDLFTTTTIFAPGAPTAASSGASRSPPLPVGPIVGGLLGGVCLALAAVGGWIWWGKAIEKRARKEVRIAVFCARVWSADVLSASVCCARRRRRRRRRLRPRRRRLRPCAYPPPPPSMCTHSAASAPP
ncbi:hypothetical protein K439DRAFT_1633846 [Ramaria rubella]|nr:hypothetical protein K439DRAFT_1633846 [Ramaria rubella]